MNSKLYKIYRVKYIRVFISKDSIIWTASYWKSVWKTKHMNEFASQQQQEIFLQIICRMCPLSYLVGTGGSFHGVKAAWAWSVTPNLHLVSRLTMSGIIISALPICLCGVSRYFVLPRVLNIVFLSSLAVY
jgi:hypothetical protein